MSGEIFMIAASYDQVISITNITDVEHPSTSTIKLSLQTSQANRVVPVSDTRFAVCVNPYIHIYDRNSKINKPAHQFAGHSTNVTDLAYYDKKYYSCSEDTTWKVWEEGQHRSTISITTSTALNAIVYIPTLDQLLTANDDGILELWNPTTGDLITTKRITDGPIRSCALKLGTSTVLCGCQDGLVIFVQIENNEITETRRVQTHRGFLTRIAVSPTGQYFATASSDSTAKIWNMDKLELKVELSGSGQTKWVWDVIFTPDGKRVCTCGTDKLCRIWDVETGKLLNQYGWHQKGVTAMTITPPVNIIH